ncbi:MAG: 4-hydroxy-3-methylbut-2-enyl diphosphate reductase [Spirochaetes bacterium]|jgi:4-hydroxy-3-methylbut-2-enyl diphosphate reductase|nr:4-hydroxy-3-methylbut-2-enyl diphosphate reductase [Spirochaetota bacterium]
MKIELARHSGFCMGVRDAILTIVEELNTAGEEILVHGPLIHNPQTVAILARRGLRTIHTLDDIDGKTIAVRTHGIPIENLRDIKARSRRYLNLTCPRVSRVQGLIKNYSGKGYYTIIIGDRDHAEVLGLKSYAAGGVTVVSDIADIHSVPGADKYIVVSQTTQDSDQFSAIVSELEKRFVGVTVFNTICDSTHNRQSDIRDGIARNIDALVVVGGRQSANTTRLAQMGRECGIRTFHVETEAELSGGDFRGVKHVLVTAGASTPGWIINNVMERLYEIQYGNSRFFPGIIVKLLDFILRTNILSAAAAALISLFALSFAGETAGMMFPLTSFLYIFAMYTLNNHFEMDSLLIRNPVKYEIQNRFKHALLPMAILALGVCLYLAARHEPVVALVYLVSCVLGAIYSTRVVKRIVESTGIGLLERAYNLKNIVSAFGWLIVTTVLPLAAAGADTSSFLGACSFVFALVLFRNILLDIIAFQGDLIFGMQTFSTILGVRSAGRIAIAVSAAAGAVFTVTALSGGKEPFLVFLANLAYFAAVYFRIRSKNYFIALKYEMLLELNFVLFAALYFLV